MDVSRTRLRSLAATLAFCTLALQFASAWHEHTLSAWQGEHLCPAEQEHCMLCHVPIVVSPELHDASAVILPCRPLKQIEPHVILPLHSPERQIQPRAPPVTQ